MGSCLAESKFISPLTGDKILYDKKLEEEFEYDLFQHYLKSKVYNEWYTKFKFVEFGFYRRSN